MYSKSSDSLIKQNDPYFLLRQYSKDSKVKSKAYSYSESYYRNMYKFFTYPLVVLSSVSTVLAGFHVNEYVLMGISLVTLTLVGFNQVIKPKDKEHEANKVKTEFAEISSDCKKFIYTNNRTSDDIRNFCEVIHELINTWNSLSPPIKDRFITQAKKEYASRSRAHREGGNVLRNIQQSPKQSNGAILEI